MAPPPRKKPKADIALLLGEPEEKPGDPALDEEPDDDLDDIDADMPDDELDEDPLDPLADPLAAESTIDPEATDLCVTLGFTDPEQQQALLDLIDLRNAPKTDMGTESALPPLPESTY